MADFDLSQLEQLSNAGSISPQTYAMAQRAKAPKDDLSDVIPAQATAAPVGMAPADPMVQNPQSYAAEMAPPVAEAPQMAAPTPTQDALKFNLDALDQLKADQAGLGAAQAEAKLKESQLLGQATKNFESLRAQQIQDEQVRKQKFDEGIAKYNDAMQNLQEQKVDPDRYYKNQTTGQKITTAIGLFLGGLGASATGGKNMAVEVIDKAIERDIEAQKAEMAKAKDGASLQGNMLALMKGRFDDERQAEIATRAAMLQGVEMKLKGLASKYASPEVAAKAKLGLDQIDLMKGQLMNQFAQATGQSQLMEKLSSGKELTGQEAAMLPKEQAERFVQNSYSTGLALTKDAATAINKVAADTAKVQAQADNVLNLASSASKLPFNEQRALAQQATELLASMSRERVLGPGTMTSDEYKRLKNIVGDPAALFSPNGIALMNKFKETIGEAARQEISQLGGPAVKVKQGLTIQPRMRG